MPHQDRGHAVPPPIAQSRRVVDVMLAVGDTSDAPEDEPTPSAVHFRQPVDFGHGVMIGPLTGVPHEKILDAMELRGLNWNSGVRQYGSLYALSHSVPSTRSDEYQLDPSRRLSMAAAILRLVRPHAMSLRHGARVITTHTGEHIIVPAGAIGPGSAAFVVDEAHRWIRDRDVEEGRALFDVFMTHREQIPQRIGHAIYAHEMIHWQRSVDVRWALLVMALEALVHTDDRHRRTAMKNRAQFLDRWSKLRSFVADVRLTEGQLLQLYEHRSHTMHGGHFGVLDERQEFPPLYQEAEEALRTVIRAALRKEPICEIFRSDASVREALGTTNLPPRFFADVGCEPMVGPRRSSSGSPRRGHASSNRGTADGSRC